MHDEQVDQCSRTVVGRGEMHDASIRGSNLRSDCLFAGGLQLAVVLLVTAPDLMWPYVIPCRPYLWVWVADRSCCNTPQ